MKPTQIVNPFVKLYDPRVVSRSRGIEYRVDRRVMYSALADYTGRKVHQLRGKSTGKVLSAMWYHNTEGPAVPSLHGEDWWCIGGHLVGRGRTPPKHFAELAALWKKEFPDSPPEPFDTVIWKAIFLQYKSDHQIARFD